MPDLSLTVAVAVVVLVLSALGVYSTKLWIRVLVGLLCLVGVILIGVQAKRQQTATAKHEESQRQLQNQIGALQGQIKYLVTTLVANMPVRETQATKKTQPQALSPPDSGAAGRKPEAIAVPQQGSAVIAQAGPLVAHIRYSTRRMPSPTDEAPYALQVIIQTDAAVTNAAFRVIATGPIHDIRFFLAGEVSVMFNKRWKVDGNTAYFQFEFPTFTPEKPLIVMLLSKTEIGIKALEVQF